MSKFKSWLPKVKFTAPFLALMIVLTLSSMIFAATYVLNHTVAITVEVTNPAPPPPLEINTPLFTDPELTVPFEAIHASYNVGGTNSFTAYVDSHITAVNNIVNLAGDTGTVQVRANLGGIVGSARQVEITVSGGDLGTWTGTANITGN